MHALFGLGALLLLCLCSCATDAQPHPPLALHPDNPRYFLFRGEPAVLITSGEHYGAVLNLDFNYVRYLDVLKSHGFNHSRAFSGAYREVPGSFNISGNTLAPAAGRFVCPWARSEARGASDGGNRFDLSKWDPAYFDRLRSFVSEAGRRGVVVEVVLFCTMYDDALWSASPMNAANNVNGVGKVGRNEVYSLKEAALTEVQEAMARKLVAELAEFDNVYFEVCNEPYERGGLSPRWNERIISAIFQAEAGLPHRHLIAQNVPAGKVQSPDPRVSVFNVHGAALESVAQNYGLGKVIALDETGGADRYDRKYRTEGWEFILAGGGVFSHLDFSFTTDKPDGTAVPLPPRTPGGGGPGIRRQLQALKVFIEGFDFIRMKPDDAVVRSASVRSGLGGNPPAAHARVRALTEPGKAYAVYVNGGTQVELSLELPAADYLAEWIDARDGSVRSQLRFRHEQGPRSLASPEYDQEIALRIRRI